MILGILSDSHGYVEPVRRALQLFDSCHVDALVHCGDVGDEHVFAEMTGRKLWFVWGNTDEPSGRLLAYLSATGVVPPVEPPLQFESVGKRFAVFHGHEPLFARASRQAKYDYLLHGHTHERRDEMVGGCRIINPGALHRARVKTVATLDVPRDELRFHEV